MLGVQYHPQGQEAIEAFNKYIQNRLYKAYDNILKSTEEEKEESLKETWNLDFMTNSFFIITIEKDSIQQDIFLKKYVLITIMKKLFKMWLKYREDEIKVFRSFDFIKGDRVLINSWIEPSPGKSPIFKRLKPIKGSKKERKDNYNIEGIIDFIRCNYCYIIIDKIKK